MIVRLYFLAALISIGAVDPDSDQDICFKGARSCGSCLVLHHECAWCLDPDFMGSTRCMQQSKLKTKCDNSFIHAPKSQLAVAKNV
ncbi:unnamed protein product [Thelazia callipaeda]|uniref:PSI_integrin domain-containing protein n=1 Tax=Thelazia callipaeda TaxID=103827 RepID=A0A0N5CZW5_THECL|nr:unnamed protein product [Thelazia callipaeda]